MELIAEVEQAVAHEHLVIEADVVKTYDEVGTAELIDEGLGFVLRIDHVFLQLGAVGAGHGDAHEVLVAPAAHIVGRAACFEVKINDVAGHALGWRCVAQPMR